jgi:hypothetical protein
LFCFKLNNVKVTLSIPEGLAFKVISIRKFHTVLCMWLVSDGVDAVCHVSHWVDCVGGAFIAVIMIVLLPSKEPKVQNSVHAFKHVKF